MRIKIDDVVFWILIFAAFVVILWLLSGSPTTESALIAIGLFIMSSVVFLYKKYFEMDKNATIGFMRVKNDLEKINDKLVNIEKLIKSRK